ncbi:MAG: NFACT family protein [Candidatus Aenigmarchaeota archaeon]|nr:NFACT family protein [Candidatus Aenigmarchaeota archaeon]
MARDDVTSLDLFYLTRELRQLEGGFIRKVYHFGRKEFLLEIYAKETYWLYVDEKRIFLTKYKKEAGNPSGFCMLLRKHLAGRKILGISQHGFDRVLEVRTAENILVIELVRPGNVVLCDKDHIVIGAAEAQEWKDRVVKRGEAYSFPRGARNPFETGLEEFDKAIRSERKIIVTLAVSLGFGSDYAREICAQADMDENTAGNALGSDAIAKLYGAMLLMKDREPDARAYGDFAAPFEMDSMKGRESGRLGSFSEALDGHFSKAAMEKQEGAKEKSERIMKQQAEALEKWERQATSAKRKAEALYENYLFVKEAMDRARKEGSRGIIIDLDGLKIDIGLGRSIEENAAAYFEKAKAARKKIARVVESIEESRKKAKEAKPERPKVRIKAKKEWYEKFRWFTSSDGFLCIGGRDADTNEMLVKRHTEANDLVFHADVQGASFVVIKNNSCKEIPQNTTREAAEFAAANSRAWARGAGTVDVYYVKPGQVSKTPPAGEHLGKGAFMVYGKKEWFRNLELKLSVGIKINPDDNSAKVICGPASAVGKQTKYHVTIRPGDKKSFELAKIVKKRLAYLAKDYAEPVNSIPIEELQRAIPSGSGDVAREK